VGYLLAARLTILGDADRTLYHDYLKRLEAGAHP
jgi:hypothetical protein